MSSFWGYMFEGSVFLVLWLWWMGHTFVGAIKSKAEGKVFIPKLSHPFPGTKIPVEIYFKLITSSIGFLATLLDDGIAWVDGDGNYRKMATVITLSIYGIFLMHSLVEIMMWYGFPWIRDSHYLTAALGFMWYALATYYSSDNDVEQALTYPELVASAITALGEKKGSTLNRIMDYLLSHEMINEKMAKPLTCKALYRAMDDGLVKRNKDSQNRFIVRNSSKRRFKLKASKHSKRSKRLIRQVSDRDSQDETERESQSESD